MGDIYSVLSSGYSAAGLTIPSNSKYVAVDPAAYEGAWRGKYANGTSYEVSVSQVSGFRAKAKYQSGSIVKFQDVLIKDGTFRVGDSKFTLVRNGVAQVKTVLTNPANGASSLETSFANRA